MKKLIILIIISSLIFLYFSSVLFSYQVIEGSQNLATAISNNYSKKVVLSQRGLIFDADENLIASNEAGYDILLDPNIFSKEKLTQLLETLEADSEFEKLILFKASDNLDELKISEKSNYSGYLLMKDISEAEYTKYFDKYGQIKGVIGIEAWTRKYEFPHEFAHTLGYLGVPSEEDLKNNSQMSVADKVGKFGVEEFYNSFLVGKTGEKAVYKSREGVSEEMILHNSKIGNSIRLTLKKDWQLALYKLIEKQMLKSKAYGAAGVIIEAQTGEVKALVSLPSFDSNKFNAGISVEDFQVLNNDLKRPLINKVISTKVAPGSTIKPFISLFALNDGVVDPTSQYVSRGCESLGTGITFCEADKRSLGTLNLASGIYKSSNLYFCNLARRYDEVFDNQGVQYLLDDFDSIGALSKSGIDINGEVSATLPSPERTQRNYKRNWSVGDMCNMAIGQGDVAMTPIKLASLHTVFDNNGKIYQPFLVKEIKDDDGKVVLENLPFEKYNVEVETKEYFEFVKRAMRNTVNESGGTANLLKGLDDALQIKTGSADAKEVMGDGRVLEGAHSWILGSFEYGGKKYSFSIVQLYGGRGFETVPVIGNFLSCLKTDFSNLYILPEPKEDDEPLTAEEKGCVIY